MAIHNQKHETAPQENSFPSIRVKSEELLVEPPSTSEMEAVNLSQDSNKVSGKFRAFVCIREGSKILSRIQH